MLLLALAACRSGSTARPQFPRDGLIRVNDVQVRGTHNSYKTPLPALDRQLDEGIRQLELDVWALPDGRFFVHHSEKDLRSSCPVLDDCLTSVRSWLQRHRESLPVYLIIENKGTPEPDTLDAAVRAAFPGRLLVSPREVVGGRWPTLAATRGRVIPVLIGDQPRTRVMFVYASSGPLAAITSRPDPVAEAADIEALVRGGLVVRTQADGDDPVLDEKRRAAAVASAAQIVSARDDSFFLPGRLSFRCDPLVPSPCRPGDLEHSSS